MEINTTIPKKVLRFKELYYTDEEDDLFRKLLELISRTSQLIRDLQGIFKMFYEK